MENEVKVGNTYKWASMHCVQTPFKITKIEENIATYIYNGESIEYIDENILQKKDVVLVDEKSAIIPTHYNDTKIDALAVIDDWKLDFRLGNTIKYIQRHMKKGNPLQDLKKAQQYLQLAIDKLEKDGKSK